MFSCTLVATLLACAASARCAAPDKPAQLKRLDSSIAAAARYLIRHQSKDGSWRSETYGVFKDGPSLTPIVMSTLFFTPQPGPSVKEAYRKGVDYLLTLVKPDGAIDAGPRGLIFPVLSSASASRVVVLLEKTQRTLHGQESFMAYLGKRQLNAALGWQPSDREFGGWGFALEIPAKPGDGEPRKMMAESNMVATIFAVAALRSAKTAPDDQSYKDALTFVEKCQNFAADSTSADPEYDDGGFYFIPGDPLQNKAGIAGKDRFGRERYYSYGSMTADGVRLLIRCGLPAEHPRVVAAMKWLEGHFDVRHVPGTYARDREVLRDATYFYYCWSVAHAFSGLGVKEIDAGDRKIDWANELTQELLRRQKPDGSWVNRYTDAKEDDPILATAWATAALALCRGSITGEADQLVPPPAPKKVAAVAIKGP